MPIVARESGGADFKPVPQGTHLAICNMIVDLGMQETNFEGRANVKHQVFLRWELPHERLEYTDKDGHEHKGPMVIGKIYTMSLHKKSALRGDLEAWRGRAFTEEELKGFDLEKVLGLGCQVVVTHRETAEGKTRAKLSTLAGWPKGMDKPLPAENPLVKYSPDDVSQFDLVPKWIQELLAKQVKPDAAGAKKPDPGHDVDDDLSDSIPF